MSSEVPSREAERGEGGFFDSLRRMLPKQISSPGALVPVLRFTGPIGVVTPLRPGMTLSTTALAIQRAFSVRGAKAVAIQINSPGGSPVQSVLIHNRIRALAKEKKLPVYTFAEDVAASGGYILAMAGDEIYADESSIVGSIGVISAGFGFDKLIKKIGVDRRVHTAGKNKMTLDPFQPEKKEDVERIKAIQKDVHDSFINLVKERRGDKLKDKDDTLFTGEFWCGKQAIEFGLIDGLSDIRTKMREKFGDDVRMRLVAPERSLFRRRLRGVFAGQDADWPDAGFSVPSFSDELISALEARALWSRFGL